MKLFELFESPILGGANNLRAIAQAATSGGEAHITLGDEPITLEHPEARFVYGLYKNCKVSERFVFGVGLPEYQGRLVINQ